MDTASTIPPQEMARYQSTARHRAAQRRQALAARRRRALEVARQAAALLKTDYRVERVMLFGSLARDEPFFPHSDIDLAVWGLDEHLLYRVVSRLLDLEPSMAIDLLRAEEVTEGFLKAIESEGIDL